MKSTNPDVQVIPGTVSATVAPAGFTSMTRIRYAVNLMPTAKDGIVDGKLSFVPPKVATAKDLEWESSFVSLAGAVVGTVTVAPTSVTFPKIPAGQSATLPVTLQSKDTHGLDEATVTTNHSWLTAKIAAPDKSMMPGEAILQVSVDATPPEGLVTGVS